MQELQSTVWLRSLPARWARNGFIFAAIFEFGRWAGGGSRDVERVLLKSDLMFRVAIEFAFMALFFSAFAWIIGLLGRRTLRLPMQVGPEVAAKQIMPKWITGAVALGLLLVLSDVVLRWRDIDHQFGQDVGADVGYLIGTIAITSVVGAIIGLVSRRGLTKAIAIDKGQTSSAA